MTAAVIGAVTLTALGVLLVRGTRAEDAAPTPLSGRIASDATNHLVVWSEDRGRGDDVYGARVSGAGVLLDRTPISISTARNTQMHSQVAFGGSNFLVVWTDDRSDKGNEEFDTFDVYGARVSREGKVVDRAAGIPISTAAEDQSIGGVAFDGTNFLVVWDSQDPEDSEDYNIFGTRISQGGTVLDRGGFVISRARGEQINPSVTFDGSNFLVAWRTSSGVELNHGIFAARVSPAGTLLDPAGIRISKGGDAFGGPILAAGDAHSFVAWSTLDESILAARVSRDGAVLDPEALLIGRGATDPSVAFDGTNYFVAWNASDDELSQAYGAQVGEDGAVLDTVEMPIVNRSDVFSTHSIVAGEAGLLFTWWEEPFDAPGASTLYGTRIDKEGTVMDRPAIVISTAKEPSAD